MVVVENVYVPSPQSCGWRTGGSISWARKPFASVLNGLDDQISQSS